MTMSEQPGQVRPIPPEHDPIIHLDFVPTCDLVHYGRPCTRPAAWIGTVHHCADKRNGIRVAFCQWYLDLRKNMQDYPQRCTCGHHFTSLINYVWDFEPLTPARKA